MSVTVGVCIPVRNEAARISRALDSVCRVAPDEIVVIDDCSDDETVAVVSRYPNVRLVWHAQKSECHLRAMAPVIESMASDYIIGMGADDVVYEPIVDRVREAAASRPGVVFCDYKTLAEPDLVTVEERGYGFDAIRTFMPHAAREHMAARPFRHECGVGAAVRADVLRWLHQTDIYSLGPWSDSWGLTVAAARYGCAYVPGFMAGFVVIAGQPSYHQRVLQSNELMQKYRKAAEAWLRRPDVAEAAQGIGLFIR